MRIGLLLPLAIAAAALPGAAAAAAAPSLQADRPCYLAGAPIGLAASGFTPGGSVALGLPGTVAPAATANAGGAFLQTITAPTAAQAGLPAYGAQPLTITALDTATGTSATATVRLTRLAFATDPGRLSPLTRRTWHFSGFLDPTRPIYGHFRLNGRTMANRRFGFPRGTCGQLTVRAPGIPYPTVRYGIWGIQVDQNPHFHTNVPTALRATLRVFRATTG